MSRSDRSEVLRAVAILASALAWLALVVFGLRAAPTPPPVRELTPHLLAGDHGTAWRFAWGTMPVGSITLLPDGTYRSRHRSGEAWEYDCCGWWDLGGGVLTLRERNRLGECVSVYRVRVAAERYPVVAGEWAGVPVLLSDPVRLAGE